MASNLAKIPNDRKKAIAHVVERCQIYYMYNVVNKILGAGV